MGRHKGSDNFNFKSFKGSEPVKDFKKVFGTDNKAQLLQPLPFKRRFRPATGTKDFSVQSDYDYASLWVRWRRGYELAMYSQQAYDGLVYSFKYYLTGSPPFGVFLPGIAFMYPSTRADMRMWMVGIRPRDSFKFIDFGYAVESVTDYGAYVKLDEYTKKGLLHISEISSSWIRNIRNFVREGQKVVLKVLRVNVEKGHIDLSLRRVTKREKIEKVISWKRERKAEALLRSVAEKTGLSPEDVYEKVGTLIEKEYGLYEGFEKVVKEGVEALTKINVPQDLATVIAEVARERIRIPMVKVKGIVELQCMKPDGLKVIKEAFVNAKKAEKPRDVKLRFYVVAAPKYRIEVLAENYKHAEAVLQRTAENVVSNVVKAGGTGIFRRKK